MPILAQTRRVGVVSSPTADVAVYFQPTMGDGSDLRQFAAAITRETKAQFGIVIIAHGDLDHPPCKTLNLSDCLELDPETGDFDLTIDLLRVVGAPVKTKADGQAHTKQCYQKSSWSVGIPMRPWKE